MKRTGDACEQHDCKRKKTDEQSTTFSRACRVCLTDEPRRRAVFTPCGHIICRACSLTMKWDAAKSGRTVICSFCRGEGKFVALDEEMIDKKQVEEEKKAIAVKEEDKIIKSAVKSMAACIVALKASLASVQESTAAQKVVGAIYDVQNTALKAAIGHLKKRPALDAFRSAECTYSRAEAYKILAKYTTAAASMTEEEAQRVQEDEEERLNEAKEELSRLSAIAEENYAKYQRINEKTEEKTGRVQEMIDEFKMENEESTTSGRHFSRACRGCSMESPRHRSFFPACGHSVCRACADGVHASEAEEMSCPICNAKGSSIPLFEEMVEQEATSS